MLLFRRSWIIVTSISLAYSSHKLIDYNMYKIQLPACLQPPADMYTLLLYLEAYIGCVSARIDLKIPLLVFKVLNGLRPLYLSELLRPRHTMRQIAATRRGDRLLQQMASCDM